MTQKKIQKIGRLPLFSKKQPGLATSSQTKSYFKSQLAERQRFRKNFLLTKKHLRSFLLTQKKVGSKLTTKKATEQLVCRLDFLIYTLSSSNNIFLTLREIRQKIRHGHFLVNNKTEKRPNYFCLSTDEIRWNKQSNQSQKNQVQNDTYSIHFQGLKNFFDKF